MRPVAFFRVEHVLVARDADGLAAWAALQQRDVFGRWGRLATAWVAPAAGWVGRANADVAASLRWRALKGCSADRWAYLCEASADDLVRAGRPKAGWRALEHAHAQGCAVVLLSDQPREALGDLTRATGAAGLIAPTLTTLDDRLTGDATGPFLAGRADRAVLARWASDHGASFDGAIAVGARSTDIPMLASVARPCAASPDAALRRTADALGWPVVTA
ncbi:MAG: hypothetical protein RLZZ383_1545 [Pseudomonadota bacterium]